MSKKLAQDLISGKVTIKDTAKAWGPHDDKYKEFYEQRSAPKFKNLLNEEKEEENVFDLLGQLSLEQIDDINNDINEGTLQLTEEELDQFYAFYDSLVEDVEQIDELTGKGQLEKIVKYHKDSASENSKNKMFGDEDRAAAIRGQALIQKRNDSLIKKKYGTNSDTTTNSRRIQIRGRDIYVNHLGQVVHKGGVLTRTEPGTPSAKTLAKTKRIVKEDTVGVTTLNKYDPEGKSIVAKPKKMKKEAAEQIDELSRDTLKSYQKEA